MESKSFLWGIICCIKQSTTHGKTNRDWWPNQLRLNILHQNSLRISMGANFNYAEEFKRNRFRTLKMILKKLSQLLKTGGLTWSYGPLFYPFSLA
jgi:catalase-peroxidase